MSFHSRSLMVRRFGILEKILMIPNIAKTQKHDNMQIFSHKLQSILSIHLYMYQLWYQMQVRHSDAMKAATTRHIRRVDRPAGANVCQA